MGPAIEQHTEPQSLTGLLRRNSSDPPLLSIGYRGLLMVAILAGMATAAAFVLIHALGAPTLNGRNQSTAAGVSTQAGKPSAFGTAATSSTLLDVKMTPPQIAKAGRQSVVIVTGYDQNDQPIAQGTGYVYSAHGIIVTSFSAIRGASSVSIETSSGPSSGPSSGKSFNVIALMGYSPSRDLAVLAVLEGNLTALETGPSEIVQEGDAVLAIGPDNAVSQGVIGLRRAIGGVDLIQITAQASPGSPVLNDRAKVIGLATQMRLGAETLTLAIPSRYISELLAEHRVLSFAQMLEETRPGSVPDPAQPTSAR